MEKMLGYRRRYEQNNTEDETLSYCRWSNDDFQCDLYCYEHINGMFVTHVAVNRPVYNEPLPPDINISEDQDGWFKRHKKIMEMLDNAHSKNIGLKYDNETFEDSTLEEFLETLLMLKAEGYHFPDYVIESVKEEINETS